MRVEANPPPRAATTKSQPTKQTPLTERRQGASAADPVEAHSVPSLSSTQALNFGDFL
jgi:hypothetical protein